MKAKHADTMFLKAIFLLLILLGYGEAMAEWSVRVLDRLGTGQVSDTATITIGGVTQTININQTIPSAYAQFNCPNGQSPYSLQTRTGFYNQQGQLVFVSGQGSGTLNCNGNGVLEIAADFTVNPVTPFLQPMPIEGIEGGSDYVLAVDEYAAIRRDNAVAAKARFTAMGELIIWGRVHSVDEGQIVLAGEKNDSDRVRCDFSWVGGRWATPPEVMSLHRDDLATVRGRYGAGSGFMSDLGDCKIVAYLPAAKAPRRMTSVPLPGAVPQAPTGASSPPAGYYQCYILTVSYSPSYSAPHCDRGDLQLNGQGSYSSTNGPGGQYFFDPGTSVVSFSGGVLNGRIALADFTNVGTYRMRMRLSGKSLPSPKQDFDIYTYEHRPSGRRE